MGTTLLWGWGWMVLGILLPWIALRVVPRGWGSPGVRHAALLALAAGAWIALAVEVGTRHDDALPDAAFWLVLAVGGAVVEGVILFGRARARGRRGGSADAPESDASVDPSLLSAEAERLLQRALALDATVAEEIMTPRSNVLTVEGGATAGDVLEEMRRSGRTRIVIVEGSLDRILGIAHAKDLVPIVLEGGSAEPVRRHLRRLLRVPRKLSLRRLLEEFRRNRVTIGAVADVRGRTLGIVSLSDMFHFLVDPRFGGSASGDDEGRRETPS